MSAVLDEARRRGITRLCHFTKAASLAAILSEKALRNAEDLRESPDGYRPTDENRLDGHLGHICLNLEYPNAWYLKYAEGREPIFRDWVILSLDLALLETPGIKFCPHNAARDSGAGIRDGIDGFRALFADRVLNRVRAPGHPAWWPTDDQAEVLVPGPIPLSRVRGVLVRSREQAELEEFRLRTLLAVPDTPPFLIAEELFDPKLLSVRIRGGVRPAEFVFRARRG